MPVTKIEIKNFKSLKHLSLEIKPLMVFVGLNGAGKSNILDAFRFLSELGELEEAVGKRGGYQQIVFDGEMGQPISFELDGSVLAGDRERRYRYFVEVGGDRLGRCRILREKFSVWPDGKKPSAKSAGSRSGRDSRAKSLVEGSHRFGALVDHLTEVCEEKVLFEFPVNGNQAQTYNEAGKQTGGIGGSGDRSYMSLFRDSDAYPVLGHFAVDMHQWALFNLLPPLMRGSLPVRRELMLLPGGQNLPVVLHTLQSESPQVFGEITRMLHGAVREINELTTALTAHQQGQTFVRVTENGLKHPTPSWGMSDGTLKLLGFLASVYSPSLPSLVCMEEPENYVHPGILKLVVDLIRNASDHSRVLLTTHSPELVDLLEPEELFIVEKQDAMTQVKGATDKKGIKKALKTLGLGEMWRSGSLGGDR